MSDGSLPPDPSRITDDHHLVAFDPQMLKPSDRPAHAEFIRLARRARVDPDPAVLMEVLRRLFPAKRTR